MSILSWFRGEKREAAKPAGSLVRLRSRLLETPLAIEPGKLEVILSVLSDRIGVAELQVVPDEVEASAIGGRTGAELPSAGGAVAVIPVHGTLVHRGIGGGLDALSGLTSYGQIRSALEAALADPSVGEVVLDIDSPGGEVAGLFDLTDFIFEARARKPITALVNEHATSAAYAIAAATGRIVAPRTAVVGSVGVIATHVDQSGADEREGYRVTHVTAGAHKADGSPHAPLSDDARLSLQARVDEMYALFVRSVAKYRDLDEEKVRGTEASVYLAGAARALGLVDEVASATSALASVLERVAGLEAQAPVLVAQAEEAAPLPVAASQADVVDVQAMLADAVAKERARVVEIYEVCRTFAGATEGPALAAKLVARGASLEESRELATDLAAKIAPETLALVSPIESEPDARTHLVAAARRLNERTRR